LRRVPRIRNLIVGCLALIALPIAAGSAQDAAPITWQDAIAALAGERTRAETCVRLLKRHGGDDAAAMSRGELAYADAKAEVDGVIAGLVVALTQDDDPESLSDLEARLTRGIEAREAFCDKATALVPDGEGTKNVVVDLVSAVAEPLIDALVEIYKHWDDKDTLRVETIKTQLKATQWSGFTDIGA